MTITGNRPPCDWIDGAAICGKPSVVRYRQFNYETWGYRCAGVHADALARGLVTVEPIPGVRPSIPAGDVEQLVADAEIQLDQIGRDDQAVLYDLLGRLRRLAGLDADAYGLTAAPMTIGSPDRCLLTLPHSSELCGKPAAHPGR